MPKDHFADCNKMDEDGNCIFGDFVYKATHVSIGYAHKIVTIEKIKGTWPEDNVLVTIADDPGNVIVKDGKPSPSHFGGIVTVISENKKEVKIYTD